MDTTDPDIIFDEDGCNHCKRAINLFETRMPLYKTGPFQVDRLRAVIQQSGRGRPYDCILGLSGGVDSTYVAYLAKQFGLRPLAVHFDNGWNSEIAVKNIEKTVKILGIDLQTHVMDWEEFRDLQRSFLKASVPDLEVPTDHAIAALLFQTALRHKVSYVLTGTNIATESILPRRWAYGFSDWRYIRSIQRIFGTRPVRSLPHYSLSKMAWYFGVRRLKTVSLLNCVPCTKQAVVAVLEEKLGWQNYGGKHHESIITRFLQSYILPSKFNIDKRKAHLSSLILSKQITRDEALAELEKKPYNESMMHEDLIFVSKKLGFTVEEFGRLMKLPTKCFLDYPSSYHRIEWLKKFMIFLQRADFLPKQVGM